MKKLLAIMTAALMGLALLLAPRGSVTAAAAGTGSITVNPPSDTEADTETTYKLYKVFVATGDGTNIRYNTVNVGDEIKASNGNTLLHSKGWTVPDVSSYATDYSETSTPHFILDTEGNVHWGTITSGATATRSPDSLSYTYAASDINDISATTDLPDYAIAAIKDYIKGDEPIDTQTATGGSGNSITFSGLDDGYYYITTTSGSLVNITSNNHEVTVTDKNNMPTVEKKITAVSAGSVDGNGRNAIAQAGSTVTYQVTVNFPEGYTNVKLHDTLGDGLALTSTAPTVTFYDANDQEVAVTTAPYTVQGTPDTGDTLTIAFNDGLRSSGITHAVVEYTATVTGAMLYQNPATNSAHVTYGDNNASTTGQHTNVYNATYGVTKYDGNGQPLAGAGFVLRKAQATTQDTYEYYKYDGTTNTVSWVSVAPTTGQTPEIAVRAAAENGTITQQITTDAKGGNTVVFTGLPDGTYELYELTVPTGYMRASNVTFTVQDATVTRTDSDGNVVPFTQANLLQYTTVTNRTGSALPTTGGIGTTIFYVIGGCLIAGAAVLLIVRKRKA